LRTNHVVNEFEKSILTGVTVGVGPLVLLFSSNVRVMIQCPFEFEVKEHLQTGHGECPASSVIIFPALNQKVESCAMLNGERLNFHFSNESNLQITPEKNSLESYVITTSYGDYPVVIF
jgi:hypothetical protein